MLPWDHNAWYHRAVLRQLPWRCDRVLDVGCGAGGLAARLAPRAVRVDALDRSPEMLAAARAAAPPNVHCVLADVLTHPLPPQAYDAVVSVSALHHLPLRPALARLRGSLRPGGILVAVALPRRDLPRELGVELTATVVHHLLGLAFLVARRLGRPAYGRAPSHDWMPVQAPRLTVREVRRAATAELPGASVRRLLLWRYLLVWQAPH